jgi:signal transduction histidine kinase
MNTQFSDLSSLDRREVEQLQAKVALLGQLLTTHEQKTTEKSDRLEKAMAELQAYAQSLAKSEQVVRRSEAALKSQAQQLQKTLYELQQAQAHLVQIEKMSSLGQMVSGIAHEINNPVNFIYGNIPSAERYTEDLLALIGLYQRHYPVSDQEIETMTAAIDLEFVKQDLPYLLQSLKLGADRIRQIVLSLRNFSRLDEAEKKFVNLHDGLDSTLLILQSRLRDKSQRPAIQIVKQYGALPAVECYAGQLNQVFMNILSNAIESFEKAVPDNSLPTVTITTTVEQYASGSTAALICISDNGAGIEDSAKERLFDPFFTTKPIGKGTGLGLHISYQIVVDKHHGSLKCISALSQGTEFQIRIPLNQPSE